MSNRKLDILNFLQQRSNSISAKDIAEQMDLDRANVSRYLNELHKENKIEKINGRPVLYRAKATKQIAEDQEDKAFSSLIGHNESLKVMVQQAKAAILYPPRGLHTIIFGKTGAGKSLFAECMYRFALESNTLPEDAPFVSFNCADYAQNPQLLFSHIFGVKKGSYTGANEDRIGLIQKADGGILFLDEIHRLPPEGQEMLFTFIDKGTYRPLGESSETYEAKVQIIGATTESSDVLLSTFNRRIPMSITLPSLEERSIDERYELVATFLQQEAQRLNQEIVVEREVLLAFMLYRAEGNIGQVQRDLKLVCAKAFLHYRTNDEDFLTITQKDLPLQVQKGLLSVKEAPDRIERLVDHRKKNFTYAPTHQKPVTDSGIGSDMSVYNAIEEQVDEMMKSGGTSAIIDLEAFVQNGMSHYFNDYLEQLTMTDVHRELVSDDVRDITERLYNLAQEELNRTYNAQSRFAFALHLQSTIERVREGRQIIHPNLNGVRKQYSKEFQVAIDLSAIIEEHYAIEIPFDEIGFITMFLTIDVEEKTQPVKKRVGVLVMMHGKSTATSMLETVQELLDTEIGVAMDMPLTMKVQDMYEQVRNFITENRSFYDEGILMLTDMGSLNSFGSMLSEELGLRVRSISMTSTPLVLEAVRMASIGRNLEDIYRSCRDSLENATRHSSLVEKKRRKAILVTCFTGEGVAKQLEERIRPIVDPLKVEVISLQFLNREAFKRRIDQLLEEYEIKTIVGTVEIDYQNIPFFSAYDAFNPEKLLIIKRIVEEELPINQMIHSLEGSLQQVGSVSDFIYSLQKLVVGLEADMNLILAPGVETGIILHMAFLIEGLKNGTLIRSFPNLEEYTRKNRIFMDQTRAAFIPLERKYGITIPEDEEAYIVHMFVENQVKAEL